MTQSKKISSQSDDERSCLRHEEETMLPDLVKTKVTSGLVGLQLNDVKVFNDSDIE